ncbi:MAG: hypothetical protein ACE5KV_00950 [Thermoplasmata archaeon]
MENTNYLVNEVKRIGLTVPVKPMMNICGIEVKDPAGVREELDKRDWKVSLSNNPPCLRVVVMPHVKREVIDSLVQDLEDICRAKGEI